MERSWLWLAGLLVLLTLAWGQVERFERVGPWIADGGPIDAAHGWSVSSRGARVTPLEDGVRIELIGPGCEQDRGCRATVWKAGPPGPHGLARSTALASWTGVRREAPRTFGLHGSVREILEHDKKGAGWPLRDLRREGSSEPVVVEGLTRLEAPAERWEVWWALSGIAGTVELRDVRASAVRIRPLWSLGVALLGLGWCGWAAAGVWSLRGTSVSRAAWWVSGALTAGVLLGTLTPDVVLDPVRVPLQVQVRKALAAASSPREASANKQPAPAPEPSTRGNWSAPEPSVVHQPVAAARTAPPVSPSHQVLPPPPSLASRVYKVLSNVDKIGHLLFFTGLAAATYLSAPARMHRTATLGLLFLAVGTELLQGFTLDRTSRWLDVGLDMLGLGAGYLIIALLLRTGIVGVRGTSGQDGEGSP